MYLTFEIEKQTKRTVRYQEVGNDQGLDKVVGTLYVQKSALQDVFGQFPEVLEVQIGTSKS